MSGASSTAAQPRVAVVIVNWRAATITISAVALVHQQDYTNHHVFVVDNGSGDGSLEHLQAASTVAETAMTVLENTKNMGFSGGCNCALKEVVEQDFDYVWLLNNDAIPAPTCLGALVATAQRRDAGLVGSWLVDPAGRDPAHSGSWMNSLTLACGPLTEEQQIEAHRYAWVTAASMLVSVPALRRVGLFDDGFFMYWEDADLNMRLRAAGYRIAIARDARVEHHAGTSSERTPVQRYLWHFASQQRWLLKHYPKPWLAQCRLRAKFVLKALVDGDGARLRALMRAQTASL